MKMQINGTNVKKTAALTAMIMMVGWLTGCSGTSGSSEIASTGSPKPSGGAVTAAPTSSAPVTITMWNRWPELKDSFTETATAFHSKNPSITVNLVDVPPAEMTAQMQTAIAGAQLPDIFPNGNYSTFPQLVSMGLIRQLDDVINADVKKRFDPGTWAEGTSTMNNHIYTYPLYTPRRPGYVMYYNKSVLQQAGLTVKDVPKTWDELVTVSQKVKQATQGQAYGLVVGFKSAYVTTGVTGQIATAISPDVAPSNQFNYKTGKYEQNSNGIVETVQFFQKLNNDKLLHPNSLLSDEFQAASLFASGKAAFFLNGSWQVNNFVNTQKFTDFDSAPIPTKDGKQQYRDYNGNLPATLYVSNSTKHPAEVKAFLEFMTDNFYPKLIQKGIEYSPIPDINQKYKAENNPLFDNVEKLQNDMFVLVPQPFSRNASAIDVQTELNGQLPKTVLSDVVTGYLAGQIKDLQSGLDTLAGQYNKALGDVITKVNSSGKKIVPSDYSFENWTPLKPYDSTLYAGLKKN
ncbi:hypothetical protein A8709_32550 [Paenibacillus pectinilyticus]|uniref:ABC transporter substrate-binding protein n=1 Tax=Paenibacillus pectinilyticus TaxID=512399 RepID=A0A1C0ZWR5_9BACL|nr:sugar ABC transporter substrate-binding protein [Paenibacillus pectinilyticus]OCT12552.1 hypothetical protein A8709_32550 [Paenibacillus pectinilyticus]